ncbi:hypothetical protein [Desulfobulbus oligotrophicus]|uniref:Helix-turn-helix domain-containing protein n=1 Tax=Desulfobulbus oligotrophicus TaxID=1909699 RepID=A0A7T5VED5_9BACT|nr:hypothetical protein [Desulfobulbus oligotrophicus]QQG66349.1 hypothetical protein HP555_10960 [Desulfobulbus oligotrophicus]
MLNDDILVGMKEICCFLRVSRRVVNRWMKEYPDMPIVKDGQRMAVAGDLAEWQRRHIKRRTVSR